MEYLNITSQICFTSKVTYCDKEPSLLPFLFVSYPTLIELKNVFYTKFLYYVEYLNETLQICFTSKVTYCDKEPSLLPFQFMSYLPLIDLKNGF